MDMESEPFINLTSLVEEDIMAAVENFSSTYENYDLTDRITLEVFTVLALICAVADVIIAFVIIKYAKLRQEPPNIILLNWSFIDLAFMVTSPVYVRVLYESTHVSTMLRQIVCTVEQLEFTLITGNILMITLLTIGWYFKLYYPNCSVKFNRCYIFFIICVYVFFCFSLGLHIYVCFHFEGLSSMQSELLLYFTILFYVFFMIFINVMHAIKKRKLINYETTNSIPILLSNTFFLTVLPIIILTVIASSIPPFTYYILTTSAVLLAKSSSIYFFIILYRYSKDFHIFFQQVLRCKFNKYENELLEQPVLYENDNVSVI